MDLLGSSLVRHMFFHIGAFYDVMMSTFSSKPRRFSWLRRHRKVGETIFLQPVSRRSSSPSYCLSSSMLKADDWPRHAGRDTFSVARYEFQAHAIFHLFLSQHVPSARNAFCRYNTYCTWHAVCRRKLVQ